MKKDPNPKRLFPTCLSGFRMGGGSQPVTNFPAIVSKFIVTDVFEQWMLTHKEFDKDMYVILNGSTGWGGRLVGILGSYSDLRKRYKVQTGRELTICYITTDPHKKVHPRFDLIINDWFRKVEPDVDRQYFKFHKKKVGSETRNFYNFCKSVMDQYGVVGGHLSLTSPPYFNREMYGGYSGSTGQSWKDFNEYDLWKEGFLKSSIRNIFNLLQPDGKFYLNIANLKDGMKIQPLESDSIMFSKEVGFDWINTYKMLLSSSGKGSINKVTVNEKVKKFEPIFVFEKK